MTYMFPVKSKERIIELQKFIKEEIPNARFTGKTDYYNNSDDIYVSIELSIEDGRKINSELLDKWREKDKPKEEKRTGFLNWVKSFFTILLILFVINCQGQQDKHGNFKDNPSISDTAKCVFTEIKLNGELEERIGYTYNKSYYNRFGTWVMDKYFFYLDYKTKQIIKVDFIYHWREYNWSNINLEIE